jgi:hypothetical protein
MRLLLRAYPRRWRDRYGEELVQLVTDSGSGFGAALDVARAGLTERARLARATLSGGVGMVIAPARRHPNALALAAFLVIAPTLTFVVGSLLAYQLGVESLRPAMETINSGVSGNGVFDIALALSPVIALMLAGMPLIRVDMHAGSHGREAVVGVRLRAANVLVGLIAVAVGLVLVWHAVSELVLEAGI